MTEFRVLLFARLREVAGESSVVVRLAPPATPDSLRAALRRRWPELTDLLARCSIAVNSQYVVGNAELEAGDEIACIPPVSGG